MKTLVAAAALLGSHVGALAVESYGDYRNYFDAKPAVVEHAPRSASRKRYGIDPRRHGTGDRVEMYRYDDGAFGRTPDLRPRSWDGGYVPMHPRSASPDGFWSPIDQSSEGRELRQQRFR
ncbi:hypothetical protein MKK88_22280 [Methylobacterium sp. E-005]|uniref:hypothetical protein n=1 Tax=Methylobacterium sp. E-005 TaxID=2836549 RepID=UPI001FBA887C|nr:hypothetical protein [Methylobacterium sp. E-005]MCJ2088684.1 hypothetical protein [Methylobacterium sp. E-005]